MWTSLWCVPMRHEVSFVSWCQFKCIQRHFTFKLVGQSSFITADLGLLQHLTTVLLLRGSFPSWSVGLSWSTIFLVDFKQDFSCSGFCPGCDRTHSSSLLNSMILIGGMRFSFCLCAGKYQSHTESIQALPFPIHIQLNAYFNLFFAYKMTTAQFAIMFCIYFVSKPDSIYTLCCFKVYFY